MLEFIERVNRAWHSVKDDMVFYRIFYLEGSMTKREREKSRYRYRHGDRALPFTGLLPR